MKSRQVAVAVVGCVLAAVVAFAADNPQLGTWKLNEAKSKIGAGAPKNGTVVYSAAGDSIKVTVDGVDGTGKSSHSEWTGKFDGKDYPVTGDTTADSRAYTKINDKTLSFSQKKDGKVTTSGKIVISADGKTRTVTTTVTGADGKKVNSTAVYDKQ
jgi:hypothetical protein